MAGLEKNFQYGTSEEMVATIKAGVQSCNQLLNPSYAGRSLSVRITARVYAMQAKLRLFSRDYILADADCAYALSLDPYQPMVRPFLPPPTPSPSPPSAQHDHLDLTSYLPESIMPNRPSISC